MYLSFNETSLPYFGVKLSCVCLMFAYRKKSQACYRLRTHITHFLIALCPHTCAWNFEVGGLQLFSMAAYKVEVPPTSSTSLGVHACPTQLYCIYMIHTYNIDKIDI